MFPKDIHFRFGRMSNHSSSNIILFDYWFYDYSFLFLAEAPHVIEDLVSVIIINLHALVSAFLCDQRLPKDRIGSLSVFIDLPRYSSPFSLSLSTRFCFQLDLLNILFLQPPLALSPFGKSSISSSLGPLVFYLNQFHLQVSLLHTLHFDCPRYHPQEYTGLITWHHFFTLF